MSYMLTAERKILIMLVYTISLSFALTGVFLFSVFNSDEFIFLTLKFLLIPIIPIFIFYIVDSFL